MSGPLVSDELPAELPAGAHNGDRAYYRRRIDELMDGRLRNIETAINSLDARADGLDRRLNYFFGGLAVIVVVAQLVGPAIVRAVIGE
jgi:hypothetical protein